MLKGVRIAKKENFQKDTVFFCKLLLGRLNMQMLWLMIVWWWLFNWLIDLFVYLLTDWLIYWLIGWQIDWLMKYLSWVLSEPSPSTSTFFIHLSTCVRMIVMITLMFRSYYSWYVHLYHSQFWSCWGGKKHIYQKKKI